MLNLRTEGIHILCGPIDEIRSQIHGVFLDKRNSSHHSVKEKYIKRIIEQYNDKIGICSMMVKIAITPLEDQTNQKLVNDELPLILTKCEDFKTSQLHGCVYSPSIFIYPVTFFNHCSFIFDFLGAISGCMKYS